MQEFQRRGLTNRDVVHDAKKFGMNKIDEASLSKYFNSAKGVLHGSLTEYSIYWLCLRYGIEIGITVQRSLSPVIKRMDRMSSLFPEISRIRHEDPELYKRLAAMAQAEENKANAESESL